MESVMTMDLRSLGTKPLFPPLGVGHWTGGTSDCGAQFPEVSSSYLPGDGGEADLGCWCRALRAQLLLSPPRPHWPKSSPSPLACPARWLWAPFLQEQRQEEATS